MTLILWLILNIALGCVVVWICEKLDLKMDQT